MRMKIGRPRLKPFSCMAWPTSGRILATTSCDTSLAGVATAVSDRQGTTIPMVIRSGISRRARRVGGIVCYLGILAAESCRK